MGYTTRMCIYWDIPQECAHMKAWELKTRSMTHTHTDKTVGPLTHQRSRDICGGVRENTIHSTISRFIYTCICIRVYIHVYIYICVHHRKTRTRVHQHLLGRCEEWGQTQSRYTKTHTHPFSVSHTRMHTHKDGRNIHTHTNAPALLRASWTRVRADTITLTNIPKTPGFASCITRS